MQDLFEAMRMSIYNYMNVDSLPARKREQVRETYSKFLHDYDVVDSLVSETMQAKDKEKETK